MKPPRTFRLLSDTWAIRPDVDLDVIGEADGMTLLSRHEIRYNPALGVGRLRQVIIHELEHALWGACGVEVSNVAPGQVEELVCASTAAARGALLRDNPRLVAWLCGGTP